MAASLRGHSVRAACSALSGWKPAPAPGHKHLTGRTNASRSRERSPARNHARSSIEHGSNPEAGHDLCIRLLVHRDDRHRCAPAQRVPCSAGGRFHDERCDFLRQRFGASRRDSAGAVRIKHSARNSRNPLGRPPPACLRAERLGPRDRPQAESRDFNSLHTRST